LWEQFLAAAGQGAESAIPGSPSSTQASDSGAGEPDSSNQPREAASPRPPSPAIAPRLQALSPILPKKTAVSWAAFLTTIAQIEDGAVRTRPADIIGLVVKSTYEDYLKEHFANCDARMEDLEQLAVYARQFTDTEEFLSQLALLTNLEAEAEAQPAPDEERLRLTTVHQAKGLEFNVVFLIMLCEGLFPSRRAMEAPEGEEEERRLFYVAITRARDELYLCYPLLRRTGKNGAETFQLASHFLNDIPRELLEEWNLHEPSMFS
jgi:DNA helicase-2/ATP-dependent DNA helicase PcrA